MRGKTLSRTNQTLCARVPSYNVGLAKQPHEPAMRSGAPQSRCDQAKPDEARRKGGLLGMTRIKRPSSPQKLSRTPETALNPPQPPRMPLVVENTHLRYGPDPMRTQSPHSSHRGPRSAQSVEDPDIYRGSPVWRFAAKSSQHFARINSPARSPTVNSSVLRTLGVNRGPRVASREYPL